MVLTLWLSMTADHPALAARPTRSRSCITSRWLSRAQVLVVAKSGEPAIDRLVRRKVFRQHAPRDNPAQHEEDRIHHLAHRPGSMAAGLAGGGSNGGEYLPLRVGQITRRVAQYRPGPPDVGVVLTGSRWGSA